LLRVGYPRLLKQKHETMGLFDFFNKGRQGANPTTDNGVFGPAFLDGLTEHIQNPKNLHSHEWRRKIKTPSGQTWFKIRFYGQLHERYPNLIVGTDLAPSLVFAIDISTGNEILLFDGCKHGYNAMFCDSFSNEQIENRPVGDFYKDQEGNDVFEIVVSTYNGINSDDELLEQVDESGFVELIDGSKVELEEAKRNAFDTLQILATNKNGKTYEIVSEELA